MENGVFSFSLLSGNGLTTDGFEAPTSICDVYAEVAIDQLKTRNDSSSPFFMFLSQEVDAVVVEILLCKLDMRVTLSYSCCVFLMMSIFLTPIPHMLYLIYKLYFAYHLKKCSCNSGILGQQSNETSKCNMSDNRCHLFPFECFYSISFSFSLTHTYAHTLFEIYRVYRQT
jgi:hypothetical protein